MAEKPSRSPKRESGVQHQTGGEPSRWWMYLERALAYADDFGAVVLAAAAVITLLGIFNLTRGNLIDPWSDFIQRWLGWGAIGIPVAMAISAAALFYRRQDQLFQVDWLRVIAMEISLIGLLGLLAILDGMDLPRAESGYGGGLVGWGIATLLGDILGAVGRAICLLLTTIAFGAYSLGGAINQLQNWVSGLSLSSLHQEDASADDEAPFTLLVQTEPSAQPAPKPTARLPREYRKSFKVKALPDERPMRPASRQENLPPLDILAQGKIAQVTSKEINLAAGLIEKTLADFGLPVRVVDFRTGPTVTQFAVEPGFIEHLNGDRKLRRHKVRVSQISALANDLALALSAPTLRIEAPVPGKSYVGIEVPNQRPALVRLRTILESDAFQSISSPLTIALGRDVAGSAVAADLAAMPHLLIAGTTGSGKSVCIASIATCLATENSPDDLRIVMVDPKMVELLRFNGLPHLYGKVETELERILGVLRWCTVEMDRRYRLLEEAKARDLEVYNRRMRRRRDGERLPRIVVMIDELADLMMMAPDQTEHTLVRLAQMARATGIHLILATQRPSTDILTGLIKANFPARISFAVASGVDSRVILDSPGAETLLGSGDMLFLSPEAGSPIRLQGVYVEDREIEALVDFWRVERGSLAESVTAPWEALLERQEMLEDRDEILEQAIELVRRRREASASMLQRALRVGYPRAARLMDELEELGVVGRPQSGGRTREVLIDEDEDPLAPEEDDEHAT
jgi:S-DNA-T family DNA segregation ATPase FtsK/SpoIIIE